MADHEATEVPTGGGIGMEATVYGIRIGDAGR